MFIHECTFPNIARIQLPSLDKANTKLLHSGLRSERNISDPT